jgi:hypothetical protein
MVQQLFTRGIVTSRSITASADGKSAWIALTVKQQYIDWRFSELAVNTSSGWRIAGGLVSEGNDNSAVNAAAKAGTLKIAALPPGKPDAGLVAAFTALTTGPFDDAAAKRADLIAFGSGPGEKTTSGAVLARAWKAAWAKHVTLDGPVVTRLAPSGTTGLVIANVWLQKTGYKVPFRVMFVFDKVGGTWSVVHVHFSTATAR